MIYMKAMMEVLQKNIRASQGLMIISIYMNVGEAESKASWTFQ